MCLPYSLWISDSLKLAADVEWNCTVSSPFSSPPPPPLSSLQTLGNHLPGRDYQGAISMSHSAHTVVSNIRSYSWPPRLAVTNLRNLKVVEAGEGEGSENSSDAFLAHYAFDGMCLLNDLYISSQVCYGQSGSNCQRWLSEKWHSLSLWGFLQVQFGAFHYIARIH